MGWEIKWNDKAILTASAEDESRNTVSINRKELSKDHGLGIIYYEPDKDKEKEWDRSFILFGDKDEELMRKEKTRDVKIPGAELKKAFAGESKIRIYTIAIPTDPELAARVRVRRVHLCTIELK